MTRHQIHTQTVRVLRACVVALWFGTFLIQVSHAANSVGRWTPEGFPNPKKDPARCGRPTVVTSNVCDPDLLLKKEQKDVLEGLVDMVSPAEVALVLVRSMNPDFIKASGSVEKATEVFARGLHDSWGVGSAQTSNGVVVFLSIADRSVYISRGRGLEQQLDAATIDAIIQDIKPDLRAKLYHTALERVVVHVDLLLGGELSKSDLAKPLLEAHAHARAGSGNEEGSSLFMIIVFFGMVIGCSLCCKQESEEARLRRGQAAMDRLVRDVESAADNRYHVTSCPICLEDFKQPVPTAPDDGATATVAAAGSATGASSSSAAAAAVAGAVAGCAPSSEAGASPIPGGPALPSPAADGRSSSANKQDPRRPMGLQCGHVFCHACLEQFLKGQDRRCPICRRPLEGGDEEDEHKQAGRARPAAAAPPAAPAAGSYDYDTGPSCGAAAAAHAPLMSDYTAQQRRGRPYVPELLFRMQRMHILHPRVMPSSTLQSMTRAVEENNPAHVRRLAAERSRAVTTMIKEARAAAAKRGSSGSSRSSFGGGRSSGGGGGRW